MTVRHKALLAIIACVFFWGFSFISIKLAVEFIPPMTLGALRFGIAILFLFIIKRKYARDEKIRKEDIFFLAGAGLTGVTIFFFFENNAVHMIPASEASIISACVPAMILIAEAVERKFFIRDKESENNIKKTSFYRTILPGAGAIISLSGVAMVAGISFSISGTARGYLYMIGACLSWVSYCFLTRPLFARRSMIYIVFWQSLIGFIGFLPFTLLELPWQIPGFHVWAHIAFLGIFCSALGYWFYAIALRDIGIGTSAFFINLIPVVSVIGGFIVLGERLQPLQWVGAVLVLAGVYIAMISSRKA
ncbi:MAG: DMT family transporter [Treponema sp.]|nr:DMT family transporter [Treponema sp.]